MPDYNELFNLDSSNKQVEISVDGSIVITNVELYGEEFELSEMLCADSQVQFGQCNASSIKFKTSNISTALKGKVLNVTISINNNEPFQVGKYKVFSDTPTADHKDRVIVAYDAMYDVLNANVAEWYVDFFENNENVTLKDFRDGFFEHFGIEQEVVELPLDDMAVEQTIGGDDISGKLIITSICEINGCFGHIGRDGKFQYIFLTEIGQGLFPALTLYPKDGLFPSPIESTTLFDAAYYYEVRYEDYLSRRINKLQIRQNEDDIGYVHGYGDNCYIVEDNFLVYGKSSVELAVIAEAMFKKINMVEYRPASIKAKGNLTIPLGTAIAVDTTYKKIYTYIFERTTTGIQGLIDQYSADGTEYHNENVNSVNRSLYQLKGKTNELSRTIEETRSTITDVESGLESEIRQTASTLETTLKAYSDTNSAAARTGAGADTDAKLANYSTTTQMNSAIQQSASNITTSVASTYATQASVQIQIDSLQAQIDDSIDTFTGPDVPTLNNYPAEDWTTTQLKDQHIGDLYIVNSEGGSYAGYYYRFEKANNVYQWSILDDTEVSKALADAGAALALAQGVADNLEVNYYTKSETNSQISQSAGNITSTVSANYETKVDATNKLNTAKDYAEDYTDGKLTLYSNTVQMNSAISQSASSITSSVAATYETKSNANTRYTSLNSSIAQTADSITAEVSRAQNAEEELAASISVNTDAINLKVSKGDVSSQISQEAGQITINSNRIAINSNYFTLTKDGKIKATDGEFSGKITSTSGTIGGFNIGSSSIYNGTNSMSSTSNGVYIGTNGINISGRFKVSSSGAVTIQPLASDPLYIGSLSARHTSIDQYGNIETGFSTYGSVKIISGASSSDEPSLVIKKTGLTTSNITTIKGDTIEVKGTYATQYKGNEIIVPNNSGATMWSLHPIANSSNKIITGNSSIVGLGIGLVDVYLGGSRIKFFASSMSGSGQTKKTVSNITTPSSASASTIATKVNDLLTALRGYGLIG